jgi:hypothetical protein
MAKTKKNGSGNGSSVTSFEAQVAKAQTSANALLAMLKALGCQVLTDEERLHTMGKLRVGEDKAMNAVFDTMDANPVVFESLADKDGGTDPNTVETQPARDALTEAEALSPLVDVLAEMHTIVSDGMIANGQFAKELSVPAYAIGKALAVTNKTIRTQLAPAITFYGVSARRNVASKQRAANAVVRATKKAKKAATANP